MKTWFAKGGDEELEWPSQSLDLNPTAHLWNAECVPGLLAQHQCLPISGMCVGGGGGSNLQKGSANI